jgi:guanyl-specific ribonuclease Sa
MQPEQSTSAVAADPHATSIEQRTTEQIRTAVLASEQRITEQFLAANAALLAQLQHPTAAPTTTNQQQSIPADATQATEGGKAAPELPIDMLDDEPEPTASEFVDFTYYGEIIPAGLECPPCDVEEPRVWTLTDDTALALSDKRTQLAYDEYLHIGCYAFFDSSANAAIGEGMDTLSNGPPLSTKQAVAVALIRAGHRTHTTTEEAARTRLGFLRLTKGGQESTDAERIFAELAHERFCRPRPTAVSGPVDALRQAFVN